MNTEPNTGENELHKLRGREAQLESQTAEERRECNLRMENLARMATQLSDCKKAIVELTVVKTAAHAN